MDCTLAFTRLLSGILHRAVRRPFFGWFADNEVPAAFVVPETLYEVSFAYLHSGELNSSAGLKDFLKRVEIKHSLRAVRQFEKIGKRQLMLPSRAAVLDVMILAHDVTTNRQGQYVAPKKVIQSISHAAL